MAQEDLSHSPDPVQRRSRRRGGWGKACGAAGVPKPRRGDHRFEKQAPSFLQGRGAKGRLRCDHAVTRRGGFTTGGRAPKEGTTRQSQVRLLAG